ncbi:spermatogenesis-associated protein 2-like protein [Anolis carolinensis]|uniref:spermatogenesis-associated protein 2-like protein n=1 Tax=Anolis carolinensis TaxID=28377 RepID=UPI002F2B54B1
MSPSAALQEEYGRCLERDFRRGHTGICADQSLKELLWHHLLADPDLHRALRGEDTLATLATALRGHLDLGATLQNLTKAFEVLELAAINLYFFPWRKEFATIKTFSGVYVHVLQGVLPEADLTRSFRRLGYVPRDGFRLALAQLPPGPALLGTACSFFAARVECEILGKLVQELEPCLPSPEELLRARRESAGSLEACVAKLRSLVQRPTRKEGTPEPPEGVDLYQEGPEEPLAGRQLPPLPLRECGATSGPWEQLPWRQPLEDRSKGDSEEPYDNGIPDPEEPSQEMAFSFISLRRELSRAAETDSSAQPLSRFLPPGAPFESTSFQGQSGLASPPSRLPRSPQLSPLDPHRPGPPCYHLHSCLFPGALPASCCNTCRSLHGSGCGTAQICRGNNHDLEELQSAKQQRLWLQRTEVDKLLHDGGGGGPWQS